MLNDVEVSIVSSTDINIMFERPFVIFRMKTEINSKIRTIKAQRLNCIILSRKIPPFISFSLVTIYIYLYFTIFLFKSQYFRQFI